MGPDNTFCKCQCDVSDWRHDWSPHSKKIKACPSRSESKVLQRSLKLEVKSGRLENNKKRPQDLWGFVFVVGCLTSLQHAKVYLRDGDPKRWRTTAEALSFNRSKMK